MAKRMLLVCASVAAFLLCAPGTAAASMGGSVTGGGAGYFPASAQPFPGDRVQLSITARNMPDGRAKGEFNMLHHSASGTLLARIHGRVDCVRVEGNTAVVTGVITKGFATPFGVPVVGHEVSYTIVDASPDSFAFGVDFLLGRSVGRCQPGAVFVMPVTEGNFTVHS